MWIKFIKPYTWKPKASVTMAFDTDNTYNAPRELAEAAIADKAAVEMRKATRTSEPVQVTKSENIWKDTDIDG